MKTIKEEVFYPYLREFTQTRYVSWSNFFLFLPQNDIMNISLSSFCSAFHFQKRLFSKPREENLGMLLSFFFSVFQKEVSSHRQTRSIYKRKVSKVPEQRKRDHSFLILEAQTKRVVGGRYQTNFLRFVGKHPSNSHSPFSCNLETLPQLCLVLPFVLGRKGRQDAKGLLSQMSMFTQLQS